MMDIKSYFIALKATWVSRLVTGNFSNWKLIPLKYFNATGKNWLVFSMNIDSTKSLNYLKKNTRILYRSSQMLEFKWWRSNKITCHIHRYQKTNYLGEQAHYF